MILIVLSNPNLRFHDSVIKSISTSKNSTETKLATKGEKNVKPIFITNSSWVLQDKENKGSEGNRGREADHRQWEKYKKYCDQHKELNEDNFHLSTFFSTGIHRQMILSHRIAIPLLITNCWNYLLSTNQ